MATMIDTGAITARSARRRTDTPTERTIAVDRDEALRQVYQWNYERLVGFFVRRTRDRPLAEDLAQDVIVRFVGALDRFDPTRPVWPYLRTIANNLLIDHLRVDERQVTVDAEEEFAEEPEPGSDLDDTVVLRSLLDGAVGDLCERQRIAVELRCERGWSVADAAEFLGVPPGTFNQLLFRARQNLREALDESGARLRGLALPLLLDLRMRARLTSDRFREFMQPTTSFGVEALAGAAVAAAIGVTAVVGIPSAEADTHPPSPQVLEVVREDVAPTSTVLPVEQQDQEVAVGERYTAEPAPTRDVSAEDAPPPSSGKATVIEAPDAVPNSGGNVTVEDDQERFVVSSEIEAKTGVREDGRDSDDVYVDCGTLVGEVLCGDDV